MLLALELDDAQQAITENLTHQAPAVVQTPRPESLPAQRDEDGARNPPPQASAEQVATGSVSPSALVMSSSPVCAGLAAGAGRIQSSLRLRRVPHKAGMEDVRRLPSIWTPKPPGALAEALEDPNYRTFSEIKPPSRPASRGPSSYARNAGTAGRTLQGMGSQSLQGASWCTSPWPGESCSRSSPSPERVRSHPQPTGQAAPHLATESLANSIAGARVKGKYVMYTA